MLNVINKRFVRFLLVGFINTCIGYPIIFVLLNMFNVGYFLSTIIGYFVGSIISFLLNRWYTFKHQGNLFHSYVKYFIIFIISYTLSYYSGKACMNLLISSAVLVKESFLTENVGVICGMVVYVIANYFGNSIFTFNKHK
jgi:putative flippase GtrA